MTPRFIRSKNIKAIWAKKCLSKTPPRVTDLLQLWATHNLNDPKQYPVLLITGNAGDGLQYLAEAIDNQMKPGILFLDRFCDERPTLTTATLCHSGRWRLHSHHAPGFPFRFAGDQVHRFLPLF
jgi:hypothetical protein